MTLTVRIARCAVTFALVLPASVAAEDVQPASEIVGEELARERFAEGREAYESGEFKRARDAFVEAYDAHHRPGLLYNLGLAEQKLGNIDAALAAFEGYLGSGDGDRDDEVRGRIAALRDIAAQHRVAKLVPMRREPQIVHVEATRDSAQRSTMTTAVLEARDERPEKSPDAHRMRRRRWAIAAAVLAVAAGVAAGIAIPLADKSKAPSQTESTGLVFHAWRTP